MATRHAVKNSWVEVHKILLEKDERAPQVPADTREVPLEMKVKGFLTHDAELGDEVEITTAAGRTIKGTLTRVNPAYTHLFGPPVPELLTVGGEVRAILRATGRVK